MQSHSILSIHSGCFWALPIFPCSVCRGMLYPEHVFLKRTNKARCCASLFREKSKEGGWESVGSAPAGSYPLLLYPPPPARYIGCYVDNTRRRTLRGVSFFDYKKMTVFRCQDNCAER